MVATVSELGERALRRIGVAVIPAADRPSLTSVVTVTTLAERALQGLGIIVPASDRPAFATVADVSAIAERALQGLAVTVTEEDRPAFATVVSVSTLAERALQGLGIIVPDSLNPGTTGVATIADLATSALQFLAVIAPDEDPSAEDQAHAEATATSVHDGMVLRGMISWASSAIPEALAEDYVRLVALRIGPAYGKSQDPAQAPVIEAKLARAALVIESQSVAEARVNAVHDSLVSRGFASWAVGAIPQAASDEYIALTAAHLAPMFGVQVDAAHIPDIEDRVRQVALILQAQDIAEERVNAAHDGLVAEGVVSWEVAAIPQAVFDEYVAIVRPLLAPLFGHDKPEPPEVRAAAVTRVRRVALLLRSQAMAEARVSTVHDSLVSQGFVSWGDDAIPRAVAEEYIALAAAHLSPVFGATVDPKGIPVLEGRVRRMAMLLGAVEQAADAVVTVHADLAARGKVRWTVFDIPPAAEDPYVAIAAAALAPEFERPVIAGDVAAAERTLARIITLPTAGERVVADYF